MTDIVLMSDPRVTGIPVAECGEPLVDLRQLPEFRIDHRLADPDGVYAHLRSGLVARLEAAQRSLPSGLRLLIVEGCRPLALQVRYFTEYADELRRDNREWTDEWVHIQASRALSPPDVAPHVAGAAVDLTLCTAAGKELDMGTKVNASPEESDLACYTAAPGISAQAAANRRLLADALTAVGMVNYPTEWWHWSYGDRYWARSTGAPVARYGPAPW